MNDYTYLYTDFYPTFIGDNIVHITSEGLHGQHHVAIYKTKEIMNFILSDQSHMYNTFVFTDWRELYNYHMDHGTLFVYIEELIDKFKVEIRNINIDNILDED